MIMVIIITIVIINNNNYDWNELKLNFFQLWKVNWIKKKIQQKKPVQTNRFLKNTKTCKNM